MEILRKNIKNIIENIWERHFLNRGPLKLRERTKVLLIFPSGLGNTVLAVGAVKSLIQGFPKAVLSAVYFQKPTREMLDILGYFRDVRFYDVQGKFRDKVLFFFFLLKNRFGIAISFFNGADYKFNVLLYSACIPLRLGFDLRSPLKFKVSPLFLSHTVRYDDKISEFENNLSLVDKLGIPLVRSVNFYVPKSVITGSERITVRIGMHVGRNNPARPGLSLSSFVEIMEGLLKYPFSVYVFGGREETGYSGTIKNNFGDRVTDFIGKLDFKETIGRIAGMDLFVSNDTGLMHIAASQGIPLIAIFGPTDTIKSAPVAKSPGQVRIITRNLSCSPCYPDQPAKACAGRNDCVSKISSESVINEILNMVNRAESLNNQPKQ